MSLAKWSGLSGAWRATYSLRGDSSFESDSPSEATVVPMLGGRFLRIDYTWSDRGKPQAGSLLIGFEPNPGLVTMVWVDTWHNGPRMLISTGALGLDDTIDVRGAYPTGPGSPDWGWRTRLDTTGRTWTMTMFNVSPEMEETLAVTAVYEKPSA